MGVDGATAAMLLEARRLEVNFDHTLTLGRQNLLCSPIYLKQLFRSLDFWPTGLNDAEFELRLCSNPYLADPLFLMLGANKVSAMDYSDFEGADVIHDLNLPLPPNLREQFDVVFDGGLLEHIFNFPTAMKSAMELVKETGHLILSTPANNYCGHGFYQFSPELFYRVLSADNGYRIKHISFVEAHTYYSAIAGRYYFASLDGRRFAVPDPHEIGGRVNLMNARPVLLNIIAQRVRVVPIFERMPQQSDYVALWEEDATQNSVPAGKRTETDSAGENAHPLKQRLSAGALLHLRMHLIDRILRGIDPFHFRKLSKNYTFANSKIFREIDLRKKREK